MPIFSHGKTRLRTFAHVSGYSQPGKPRGGSSWPSVDGPCSYLQRPAVPNQKRKFFCFVKKQKGPSAPPLLCSPLGDLDTTPLAEKTCRCSSLSRYPPARPPPLWRVQVHWPDRPAEVPRNCRSVPAVQRRAHYLSCSPVPARGGRQELRSSLASTGLSRRLAPPESAAPCFRNAPGATHAVHDEAPGSRRGLPSCVPCNLISVPL